MQVESREQEPRSLVVLDASRARRVLAAARHELGGEGRDNGARMKVWLDDTREARRRWIHVKTPEQQSTVFVPARSKRSASTMISGSGRLSTSARVTTCSGRRRRPWRPRSNGNRACLAVAKTVGAYTGSLHWSLASATIGRSHECQMPKWATATPSAAQARNPKREFGLTTGSTPRQVRVSSNSRKGG